METSFNLYALQSNSYELLTVDIYKDHGGRYVVFDDKIKFINTRIYLTSLKVKHLRDHVCGLKGVGDKNDLKLWKLTDEEMIENIENEDISTDDDIEKKLNGTEMKYQHLFKACFKTELDKLDADNKYEPVSSIITIIPATNAQNRNVGPGALNLNLPETLEYRDPQPLLKGSGSSWDFQASDDLKKKLKDIIHDHYKFWEKGEQEKTKIPQYFILAGAGEGKSRTAQELPKLLVECTNDDDVDLHNRLDSALVFNLSFENGTKLFREEEATSSSAIANRMLFQLLQQPNESWIDYKNRYNITPNEVLRRIAKHRNQKFEDLSAIIILDGIQVAMYNPAFFYNCITLLGILSLLEPFIVTCCTATISTPIYDFVASSQQRRVYLPVTSLQSPRINSSPVFEDNPVMNMLINDMGGHGRALEALGESVRDKDLKNINFVDLINDVRLRLTDNYQGWLSKTEYLRPVLRIVLSHTEVHKNRNIATFEGKEINVDDVTQFGLVRFKSLSTDQLVGYLECPYIWLWIMAHGSPNDQLLTNWNFNYYNAVRNQAGEPSIPPGCQYWQNFEHFVAQFRSLKSNIYDDDEQVELGIIHNGARHNFGNNSIYNRKLTLEQSVERVSTKSGDYNQGLIDVTNARHLIINAPGAESGDSFCPIKMVGTGQLQTEVHQCKLVKQTISQNKFNDEHKKATSLGDTFIFYTSATSKGLILHQPMTAIVSVDNWEEYFRFFSGRCFHYAMGPPDVNKATYTQLTGIDFIKKEHVKTILEEAKKLEFSGINDCANRTKIPRIYLKPFFSDQLKETVDEDVLMANDGDM